MNTQDPHACRTCGELLSPESVACPRDGTPRGGDSPAQSTQSILPPEALVPLLPGKSPETPPVASPVPASEPAAPDAMLGQRLGDYVVRGRLGSGGMGAVYAGEHVTLGSKVAIKLILEEHARGPHARDLLNEARAASAIRHHGIIDVFGFGQQPGIGQYLVMEHLEGLPLNEFIRRNAPLAPAVALPLLCEVLDALSAAHAVGVIHRDLKPSNIFVVRQSNGTEYIKVLDFGLAKRSRAPDELTPQTRSDVIIGTPQYMSPEQALCEAVSPQTDLYAVGVIAFELLTGQRPFTGRSHMEVVAHHIKSPPPLPSSLVAQAPELDALVLRLLAKEPSRRPASASQVAAELRALLHAPLSPAPRTSAPSLAVVRPSEAITPNDRTATLSPSPVIPPPASPRPVPRGPWTWGALAGATLAVVSGLGILMSKQGVVLPAARQSESPPRVVVAAPPTTEVPPSSRAVEHEPRPEPQPSLPLAAAPLPTPAAAPASVPTPKRKQVVATPVARRTEARPAAPLVPSSEASPEPAPPTARPSPEPAAMGVLHLAVKGAWADVVVNGQRLGRVPPQNSYPLTSGEHQLELRNPNLETYRQRITIPPHGTLSHSVDFTSGTRTPTP